MRVKWRETYVLSQKGSTTERASRRSPGPHAARKHMPSVCVSRTSTPRPTSCFLMTYPLQTSRIRHPAGRAGGQGWYRVRATEATGSKGTARIGYGEHTSEGKQAAFCPALQPSIRAGGLLPTSCSDEEQRGR